GEDFAERIAVSVGVRDAVVDAGARLSDHVARFRRTYRPGADGTRVRAARHALRADDGAAAVDDRGSVGARARSVEADGPEVALRDAVRIVLERDGGAGRRRVFSRLRDGPGHDVSATARGRLDRGG